VESVAGGAFPWQYTYGMNGNMKSDGQRNVTYDDQDRPVQITLGNVVTSFRYTPDGDRYLQRTIDTSNGSVNHTVYYVDKLYERIDHDTAPSEETTYCGKSAVIEQRSTLTAPFFTRDVHYIHLDRLGSTEAVTDASGTELFTDGHGYDAFGKPRGREWLSSNDQMNGQTTRHGFTGHEQLDETFLTHMNGRIYDYRLGRFLSVDPLIGSPLNTQSINPYSYGGNNPLSGVDPTGYAFFGGGLCDDEAGPCSSIEINGPGPGGTSGKKTLVINDNGKLTAGIYTMGTNPAIDKLLNPAAVGQGTTSTTELQGYQSVGAAGTKPWAAYYRYLDGPDPGGGVQTTSVQSNLIRNCASETCIVNGRDYADNFQIPGNNPVPVTDAAGAPVLDSSGKPMVGPSRANLDQITEYLRADFDNKSKFRQNGDWDFQRLRDDKGATIYTKEYREFANYAIGYAFSGSGHGWLEAAVIADAYAFLHSSFPNEPKDPILRSLPRTLMYDYKTGGDVWAKNASLRNPQPEAGYTGPL
jgi:RHS repeat-associated protein